MRAARTILFFVLPLAAAALLGILAHLEVLQRLDGKAYDRLFLMKPAAPAAKNILLVDMDSQAGSLPGLLSDGLVLFKEMDARYAVLDLPLAQKSPPALDPSALRQTLPNALDREFSQMQENIQSLFDAIRRGSVRPREAARYVSDLVGLVGKAKERLFGAAMGIERDDDALLGQAAVFFGNVYVPLGLPDTVDFAASTDLSDLARQRQAITVLVTGRDPSYHAVGLRPSVLPLVRAARGGGFPSDKADPDGVVRRTRLLAQTGAQHFGQLAFVAMLDLLGSPAVEASPGRVLLRGAVLPGRQPETLVIPLDGSGEMLLNWPRAADDGFRHLPWSDVVQEMRLEDSLVSDLRDFDAKGYLSYLRSSEGLLDVYEEGARIGRSMLAAGNNAEADQWRAARGKFFSLCGQFLGGDAERRITADADREIQGGALSAEEKQIVRSAKDRVPGGFADARQLFSRLQDLRSSLRDSLAGSFCIISLAPEDGVPRPAATPLDTPGTDARASAALVSTVLSAQFLREGSAGAALLAAAILSLLLAFAVLRLKPLLSLVVGISAAAAAAAGIGFAFTLFGFFLPPSVPVAGLAVTGIALSSLKLAWKRGASRTIRAAFAGRVSAESFQQIDAARSHLAPDGSRRKVTVLCLAQAAASREPVSEDPGEVVRRLRTHRAAVREAVLGLGGMVTGSGGGRVTASFGAPLPNEDHARRALLSALRVRALEAALNGPSFPVFSSRIGIHTGTCVAAYLGPRALPDWSLAGAPMEIAVRLELLNGTFGTSVIVSDEARAAAGPGFVVRKLGTISGAGGTGGAGGEAALPIFELLAEKGSPEGPLDQLIREFEEGVACYEKGDVSGALALFSRVLASVPGDGPSASYARRCRQLLQQPGRPDFTSFPW
jgi:class 3 adenylate cyclase/CHASE2 domain-containing sensor protein